MYHARSTGSFESRQGRCTQHSQQRTSCCTEEGHSVQGKEQTWLGHRKSADHPPMTGRPERNSNRKNVLIQSWWATASFPQRFEVGQLQLLQERQRLQDVAIYLTSNARCIVGTQHYRGAQGTDRNKNKISSLPSQNHNLVERTAINTFTRNYSANQNSGERYNRRTNAAGGEISKQSILLCPCIKPFNGTEAILQTLSQSPLHSLLPAYVTSLLSSPLPQLTTIQPHWPFSFSGKMPHFSLVRALAPGCLAFALVVPQPLPCLAPSQTPPFQLLPILPTFGALL